MTNLNFTPAQKETFTLGSILVDTWGRDQTNIDFFCIVKVTGTFITVQKMSKVTGEEKGFMTFDNMPGEIDQTQKPIRKKLKVNRTTGEAIGFSFRDYTGGGWCRLWNGKPTTSTHYA
jgi:hypothetical protein